MDPPGRSPVQLVHIVYYRPKKQTFFLIAGAAYARSSTADAFLF
jgi:hypothetical protein